MATNSALIPLVGSDFGDPKQFTAASPSFNKYFTIPNGIVTSFGDVVGGVAGPNGIVPLGYLSVQFHNQNQWTTGNYYTSLTGAQIATIYA